MSNCGMRCLNLFLAVLLLEWCLPIEKSIGENEIRTSAEDIQVRVASAKDMGQVQEILSGEVLNESLPKERRIRAILICGKTYKDKNINALLLRCLAADDRDCEVSISLSALQAFHMIGPTATNQVLEELKKAVRENADEILKRKLVEALIATQKTSTAAVEEWGKANLEKLDPKVSYTIRLYGTQW